MPDHGPAAGVRSGKSLSIIHTEASLGWGGQEIRILTEAAGMVRRGHRVSLVCPPEARIFSEAQRRNLPVAALPIGRKNLVGFLALRRWLKAHPADIVNTHSSTDSWLAALARLGLAKPPALVRTRHISAPIPDNAPTRWLYRKAAAHIVTTGENLRQQLIRDNGYRADTITSVPTGIDTDLFVPGDRLEARRQLGIESDGMIIGIVATLRSWKGHRYLIEAFAGMPDKRAKLLIVGDGPQRAALERQVAESGLTGRVLLPGNQREVLPWLQAMDVFVLPSYANEGVPQAILQAMLCALPIVTTPVGSIPEAVKDGETALIVEPKNAHAVRAAIERLGNDPGLRESLGRSARARALQWFGLDAMLDKMEAVFLNVVNHG